MSNDTSTATNATDALAVNENFFARHGLALAILLGQRTEDSNSCGGKAAGN